MTNRRLTDRIHGEAAFGLIELLIALTVLTIAIGALLALFASSIAALAHSGKEGSAVTLADRQLETYRAMPFNCIPTALPFTPPSGCGAYTGFPNPYTAVQVTTTDESPDQRIYRVTTAVTGASGSTTQIKVTVVQNSGGPVLAQETSFFSSAGTASS